MDTSSFRVVVSLAGIEFDMGCPDACFAIMKSPAQLTTERIGDSVREVKGDLWSGRRRFGGLGAGCPLDRGTLR